MTFVTVHFDDSGTHTESNSALAACFISTVEKWEMLEREWREIADQEGFRTFHMTDFAAKQEEFAGWSNDKCKRVLGRLCALINIRVRTGLVASVTKRDYDDLVSGDFRTKYAGTYHYTFTVRSCATGVRQWRDRFEPACILRYVFDQGTKGKGEIMKVLASSTKQAERNGVANSLASYSFKDSRLILPLQAADILAWSYFQKTQLLTANRQLSPLAEFALAMLQKGTIMGLIYTREKLAKWVTAEKAEWDRLGCPEFIP